MSCVTLRSNPVSPCVEQHDSDGDDNDADDDGHETKFNNAYKLKDSVPTMRHVISLSDGRGPNGLHCRHLLLWI